MSITSLYQDTTTPYHRTSNPAIFLGELCFLQRMVLLDPLHRFFYVHVLLGFTGVHEYEDKVWVEPQIFPSEEVLQEKSEVYFCCVGQRKSQVTSLIFNQTSYPLINISSHVKAIAVDNLNVTSVFGVDFECLNSQDNRNYTVNFVTC